MTQMTRIKRMKADGPVDATIGVAASPIEAKLNQPLSP
jgi:hypothetical protein